MNIRHICDRARTIAFALAIAMPATARAGEQIDQAELMKWVSVTQVKYAIVGEFEGHDRMIVDKHGGYASVKDRAEIDLVWDQTTAKVVGQPTIRNFATEVSDLRNFEKTCTTPILSSAYEHITIEEFGRSPNSLGMKSTRTYAAADSDECTGGGPQFIPAKQVEEVTQYLLPQSIQLAVPQESQDSSVSVDKKTSTITLKKDGWTWTHKLSPVK